MTEEFKINREDLKDEEFLKFVKKYEKHMNHFTKIIMMIEPDEMFIKSNMKKLMYYIYKNELK